MVIRQRIAWILFALSTAAADRALAHEVTVHHRLSQGAVMRSKNMAWFVDAFQIDELQPFPDTPTTGALLAGLDPRATIFPTPALLIAAKMPADNLAGYAGEVNCFRWTPMDLVRTGSIVEDASPRWCNHFYTPTGQNTGVGLNVGVNHLEHGVCGPTYSASQWALTNEYGWYAAMNDYYRGFTLASNTERQQAWARMFYDLGHVVHLLQDLSQPSHTRNDSHGCRPSSHPMAFGPLGCAAFERFFDLRGNRPTVDAIVANSPGSIWFESPQAYFSNMANVSATQFFSDDTIEIVPWLGIGGLPYPPTLQPPLDPHAPVPPGTVIDPYIRNLGLGPPFNLVARLARPPVDASHPALYTINDQAVLHSYAINLYPAAVQLSAGLLDFFFRARLQAKILEIEPLAGSDFDDVTIEVANTSEPIGGASPSELTLQDPGAIEFYLENGDERQRLMGFVENAAPLQRGGTARFRVRFPKRSRSGGGATSDTPPERPVTLVYRGQIGSQPGVVGTRTELPVKDVLIAVSMSDAQAAAGDADHLLRYSGNGALESLNARPFSADASTSGVCGCPYDNNDPVDVVTSQSRGQILLHIQACGGRFESNQQLTRTRTRRRPPTEQEARDLDQNPHCCSAFGAGPKTSAFTGQFYATVPPRKAIVMEFHLTRSGASGSTGELPERRQQAKVTFLTGSFLVTHRLPTLCMGDADPDDVCDLGRGQDSVRYIFCHRQLKAAREAAIAALRRQVGGVIPPIPPPGVPPLPPSFVDAPDDDPIDIAPPPNGSLPPGFNSLPGLTAGALQTIQTLAAGCPTEPDEGADELSDELLPFLITVSTELRMDRKDYSTVDQQVSFDWSYELIDEDGATCTPVP